MKLVMKVSKNNLLNIERNMMFPYSDKKIIAKPPLLYSVLKPDTNSDSPSAKSNGARLVSAINKQNQHIIHIGFIVNINQVLSNNLSSLYDKTNINTTKIIKI